jgi:hypothetical protein
MKRILLSLGLLLTTMAAMAQVPQGINYQAVMRGSDGSSIVNQACEHPPDHHRAIAVGVSGDAHHHYQPIRAGEPHYRFRYARAGRLLGHRLGQRPLHCADGGGHQRRKCFCVLRQPAVDERALRAVCGKTADSPQAHLARQAPQARKVK